MWYRLEVKVNGGWIGYYNGLRNAHGYGQITNRQYEGIYCCLAGPPTYLYSDENNQPEAWASQKGRKALWRDWKKAIAICETSRIPWRRIKCEDPGTLKWEDDDQGIFAPTASREIRVTSRNKRFTNRKRRTA